MMAVQAPPRPQPVEPAAEERPFANGRAEATPPERRPWRRTALFAVLVLVVIVAAVLTARWIAFNRTHASTDDATVDGDLYSVNARLSGRVARVLVSENDP